MEVQNLLVENQQLNVEVQRRIDQLSAIAAVASSISQSLDLNQTLQTALSAVLTVTGAQAGGISLIDEEAGEVVLRAQQGWHRDFVNENPMRIPLGKGISGRVIATDTVFWSNRLDETEPLAVMRFHDENFRSMAMAPMHARGKVIGILSIMSSKIDSFDESHISVLKSVADTVGVALDNARLYEYSIEDQRRLSAVLQSSADGIIATDQSGRIQMVNHTAELLLETPAAQLTGVPLREAPIIDSVRNSLLLATSSRTEAAARTFRVSTPSGRVLSVLVSPVYVEQQVLATLETEGWVIVLQDVTLSAEMERARSAFIKAAAHDMRNPLTAAQNAVEMLRRLIQTKDLTLLEVMEIAQTGIGRIQGLIDDLVSIELIQSSYEINLSEVDIGELLYEVTGNMRSQFERRSQQLRLEVTNPIPPLLLDRKWTMRAVQNYLDNAIKHTPPEGVIVLRSYIQEEQLHIEVIDRGEGIPLDAQAHLFERFYRAHKNSGIPGAGLGLAMVKSISEAHGGTVYVQSKPGAGSTFGMTFSLRYTHETALR
ncbi:MAG: putative two-component sensor histidine kinase [Chloroflexi bacterium OLB15]|nr:MAG: putative two-component sensor histidine kinase [Chloroflexi bacterium OLB15]